MLVACGKKDSEKAFDEKVKEVKEQVTKNGEEGLESTKLLAKLFNKATYKVNKVEENGDSAQLDVTIKAVNLGRYMDELSAHLQNTASAESTEEELNKIAVEYFTELLKNEIFIAIDLRKDSFEPDLKKPINSNESVQNYNAGVSDFVEIVRDLELNKNIWKS